MTERTLSAIANTPAENALDGVLDEIEDYLEQRQDVRDGGDGVPQANTEMSLLSDLKWWRDSAKRTRSENANRTPENGPLQRAPEHVTGTNPALNPKAAWPFPERADKSQSLGETLRAKGFADVPRDQIPAKYRPDCSTNEQAGRIPALEATRINADYWRNAAYEQEGGAERSNAFEQAICAWKNAAYAAHDLLARPSSAVVPAEVMAKAAEFKGRADDAGFLARAIINSFSSTSSGPSEDEVIQRFQQWSILLDAKGAQEFWSDVHWLRTSSANSNMLHPCDNFGYVHADCTSACAREKNGQTPCAIKTPTSK